MMRKLFLLILLSVFLIGGNAYALTITSQLTGDIRGENPDFLVVDVTIDISGNTAEWVVDLNMLQTHPDVKLDEFYFNIADPTDIYTFGGFSPTDWIVTTAGNTQGAGGGLFVFESADNINGSGDDVTNDISLYFTMTKTTGDFTLTGDEFFNAPLTILNDGLGEAQLGAHLQSLNYIGDPIPTTDSGFAVGIYSRTPGGPGPVPEPTTLLLLGSGLVGLAGIGRKKLKK